MSNILIHKVVIASMFILGFFVAGCHQTTAYQQTDYSKIAGTWKADKGGWQIVISKEGEICEATHPLGEAVIRPNEVTYITMKDDSRSSYKGGAFTLLYDPDKREIEVFIEVEKIKIKYLNSEIEGKTETRIGGTLSEDFKVWDAEIIEKIDYGPRFPQGPVTSKPLLFRKVK